MADAVGAGWYRDLRPSVLATLGLLPVSSQQTGSNQPTTQLREHREPRAGWGPVRTGNK